MKEKLMSLFSGKALYVSIASILVCAVAVSGSVIAVKVNNNKLQKERESLSNSITETTTEVVTEPSSEATQSEIENITSQDVGQVKSEYGDKGIAYLKEYDKLTETYKAKRAELEGQLVLTMVEKNTVPRDISGVGSKPILREREYWETDEEYAKRVSQYEFNCAEWEQRKKEYDIKVSIRTSQFDQAEKERDKKVSLQNQKNDDLKFKIAELDGQYQKDVNSLKVKYGIK